MMTILIEHQVPERGTFQINRSITIKLSAQEARKKVDRWLLHYVSTMLGADEPQLRVGTQTVWVVPIYFGAPHTGRVGQVGTVEVDAISGELLKLIERKAEIEKHAHMLAENLPPFRLRSTPDEYVAENLSVSHPIAPPSGSPLDLLEAEVPSVDV